MTVSDQRNTGLHLTNRGAALLLLCFCSIAPAWAFGFQDVVAQAKHASEHADRPPQQLTGKLADLDYDQYRAIHYKPGHALWPDRDFHVQFFAPGYRFVTPVKINIVDAQGVHEQHFRRSDFVTGDAYPHDVPTGLGFAGFRLHYDGYDPDHAIAAKNNELIAFLGASYFRAKAADQQFGVSARGLAIDTIAPGPEQFPTFREFWIRKPAADAQSVVVYARLAGKSATGAYQFTITPGKPATVDVRATIFLRHPVHELGIAPFSSMYLYGVGNHRPPVYLRPAVHDSQGLLIRDRHDRWTWRPLANPQTVRQYSFSLDSPKGFGLVQRNRDFFDYQSISMAYQARPSVWVKPRGNWGRGQLRLVEIPSSAEYNDNIALFWTPQPQPAPHKPIHFAYRMVWGDAVVRQAPGRVTSTLSTRHSRRDSTTFIVDFTGPTLANSSSDARVKPVMQVGDNGKLLHSRLAPLGAGKYRLQFTVRPVDGKPIQLRAYLTHNGHAITETWDYVVTPAATQ